MSDAAIDIHHSRQHSATLSEEAVVRKAPSFLQSLKSSFHQRNTQNDDLARSSWMSALNTTSMGLGPTSTVAIPTARSVASITKVRMFTTNRRHRKAIDDWMEHLRGSSISDFVILDVEYWYQVWFLVTVVAAFISGWVTMYDLGFIGDGDFENATFAAINSVLLIIFGLDMMISLFVSKEADGTRITDPWEIKRIYFRGQFWLDILGTLPFDTIVVSAAGMKPRTADAGYIGLLGLLSLLRLYRMFRFFHYLETSVVVNQVTTTLFRNFVYIFFTLHWAACLFYYIARQQHFNGHSWVGSTPAYFENKTTWQKYWVAVYWSATTVTTIGYGDIHPYTTAEFIFTIFLMVLNLALGAYFIGSITLLVTTHDRKAQKFRESVASLQRYTASVEVEQAVLDDVHPYLDTQRKLDIGPNKAIHNLPTTVRKRLLRSVYRDTLKQCYLLNSELTENHLSQSFRDALLAAAHVEVFLPMVHIVVKEESVNELYIIINGAVQTKGSEPAFNRHDFNWRKQSFELPAEVISTLEDGMPIAEAAFFNQTPSRLFYTAGPEGCRTLTISREKWNTLCQGYSGVTQAMKDTARYQQDGVFQPDISRKPSLKGGIKGAQDDLKFIQAAAAGQLDTVRQMLDNGQDVNATDYGHHTALMSAALHHRKEVVIYLLEQKAEVDLQNCFGLTALHIAAQQMHADVVNMLVQYGASLGMQEPDVASKLCQIVRQQNAAQLGVFVRAGADINAMDYDSRTALHVAAAQGDSNLNLVQLLVRAGARVDQKDRWGQTAIDEAVKVGATSVADFLLAQVPQPTPQGLHGLHRV